MTAMGCTAILGGGGYTTAAPNEDSGQTVADTSVSDAPPSDAGTDTSCSQSAATKAGFESACTSGTCSPFDNASKNPQCTSGGTVCPAVGAVDAAIADTSTAPDTSTPPDSGADNEAGAPPDAGPTLPSCFSLTQGPAGGALPSPIIYATGSTAIQPYVAKVSQVLQSIGKASIVYLGAGSCLGVGAMTDPTTNPLRTIGKTASYYDSTLSNGAVIQGTCAVDDPAKIADIGISDVFATTCQPALIQTGGLPNNLHDFAGPVQVMEMVVPQSSHQTAISAEASYMVWGFGAASGVAPWTDEGYLLQRSASSGTQNMINAAIQAVGTLTTAQWHGVKNGSSGAVLTAISNVQHGQTISGGSGAPSDAPDRTVGILASDIADANRLVLRPLAFQDVGESCGWFPDSTVASFDKRNVRDGHYPIWGQSHFIAYADTNGNPVNAAVGTLIKFMTGTSADVTSVVDVIGFFAQSHIVPTCAMKVQRAQDGGEYASFKPPVACGCYYEFQASTGQQPAGCVTCSKDSDCASAPNGATSCVKFGTPPTGYCEVP
jgi:hypothetical protein